ncbi:unnamed protein product [Heterobilharzia americana]|nr:unnamed protein product [Heterobilharzia americana]
MSIQPQSVDSSDDHKKTDLAIKLLPTIARAVKLSQEFPVSDTPAYIYYNDFPQYKAVAAGQSRKILSILQNVMDILDAKANVLDVPVTKSLQEKFTSIVDANDRILERLAMAMDFEEDPQRKEFFMKTRAEDLVVAVHRKNTTSLEWLKSKNSSEADAEKIGLSENSLKLLSSKHIVRPQSFFSTPPDNSRSPFRPIIKSKPNCIVPLSESLFKDDDESEEYPHPYQAELKAFSSSVPSWNAMLLEDFPTKHMDESYHFVDKLDALQETIKSLSACKYIAVDLEHHNYRTFLGITCLIQISTLDTDYIIDALTLRDHLSILNEVFTDPKIVKVFHGSDSDLMWLQRDFGVYVVNLFDTGLAARLLQYCRFSLSYLLHRFVGVHPNKKYQLADWRIRPLPEELVKYARTDTHYLLHIASRMCQELQDRDLLSIAVERARQLCLKCYTKPEFRRLGYLDLYRQTGSSSFSHRQLYALENLYALRDSIARREDESIHYVLPNHMLKVIAEVLPRESSGIFACCNPIPPLVRKYVHDLHKIVLDARNLPITDLPLTSDQLEASAQQDSRQQDDRRSSLNMSTVENLKYALPHDYSHSTQVFVTDLNNVSSTEIPQNEQPSVFASAFLSKNFITHSVIIEQESEEKKLLNDEFLDPNHILLKKLLALLKLPCSPLVVSADQSSVNTPTSVQNGASQQSEIMEDSDILNTTEHVIKLDVDSTSDGSLLSDNQYSTTSKARPSNELKRTHLHETISKPSVHDYSNEDVILLCNEKVNAKAKKRRKTQEKNNSVIQSDDNSVTNPELGDDICTSVKCEPTPESLEESTTDCSFTKPSHSSTRGSGKKNKSKFREFRVHFLRQECESISC